MATSQGASGLEPRRADFVAWSLAERSLLKPGQLRQPPRVSFAQLARVHSSKLLERLDDRDLLEHVFATELGPRQAQELVHMVRVATGGTIAAAQESLARGTHTLNLLGGFHHAGPDVAGGLCLVNDIAVAIAQLRADGFDGQVAVLDLDVHPPDGTAACLVADDKAWVGSLSGSDWGPMEGVDETLLPGGAEDAAYLKALDALISRMPEAQLAFVVAGADVLEEDRFGTLGMTVGGVRRRDARVAQALERVPTVWLPGGGYSPSAWRVLANTALVLLGGDLQELPEGSQPLQERFDRIFGGLQTASLGGEMLLAPGELEEALGLPPSAEPRLLGFYTAAGLEHACYQYGILDQLRRLGFGDFECTIDRASGGERAQLHGHALGQRHLLVEMVVERVESQGHTYLFVNWLTLRNPLARFSRQRPKLPGQEEPGLGLADEFGELLQLMARRLELRGVLFRPAWFHVAYVNRKRFVFNDPARQGRFEAMLRDLGERPLLRVTQEVADGRVQINGRPYTWEATDMVERGDRGSEWRALVQAEARGVRFTSLASDP